MCLYCGADTVSFGGETFCSNCELIVKNNRGKLIALVPDIVNSLDAINKLLKNRNFSEANDRYSSIINTVDDPIFLYAYGIFLIMYSNFNLSKISYYREGFMEENIGYRKDSWKIYGNARMFLYRCIDKTEKNHDLNSLQKRFVIFLSMVKLGNIRSANIELEKIKKLRNKHVYMYAKIVIDSNTGCYKQVIANSEKFLLDKYYPQNVVYYLAFALFKIGKIKESIQISKFMDERFPNNKYKDLVLDIEKTISLN